MSVRLYVKLPKNDIEKEGLEKMFSEFEPSFTTKIIKERKNGKCRGFGFITVATDENAEEFIAKYNEQILSYDDQVVKDEDGSDFKLLIEKALPRTKPETPISTKEKPLISGEKPVIADKTTNEENTSEDSENKTGETLIVTNTEKPTPAQSGRKSGGKKGKGKSSNNGGIRKTTSVAESAQPDPRWANELLKLKERFEKQTSNS